MGKKILVFFILIFSFFPQYTYAQLDPTPPPVQDAWDLTVEVPTGAEDVEFDMTSVPSGTVATDTEIEFTIDYRLTNGNGDFKIIASWERGLVTSTGSTYIDIFEYVLNSASDAPGASSPVVDQLNRTITWTINDLQSSPTLDSVTFKLRTLDLILASDVTSSVRAISLVNEVFAKSKTLPFTITANFVPTSTPRPSVTPTPGPGPSSTPTPPSAITPSVSPTKRPIVPPFVFTDITVTTVTDTTATVHFSTSLDSSYSIYIEKKPVFGSPESTDVSFSSDHDYTFKNLEPGTDYYFMIRAKGRDGRALESDIFTFKTASGPLKQLLDEENFIIAWNKLLLKAKSVYQGQNKNVVAPINTVISINAPVLEPGKIKEVRVRWNNKRVLGIFSNGNNRTVEEVYLVEILPGIYGGELKTPPTTGEYTLEFFIRDNQNGFTTKSLPFNFYISRPITVVNRKTGRPVEKALFDIKKYEESRNIFVPLEQGFEISTATNQNGEYLVSLPSGRYSMTVSSIGYKSQTLDMDLGTGTLQYPKINLEPSYNIFDILHYYFSAGIDLSSFNVNHLTDVITSNRATDVHNVLLVLLTIFLALFTASRKLSIGIFDVGLHMIRHILRFILNRLGMKKDIAITVLLHGKESKKIPGVALYILNTQNHIVYKTFTDRSGEAHVPNNILHQGKDSIRIFLHHKLMYAYPYTFTLSELENAAISLHMYRDEEEKVVEKVTAYISLIIPSAVAFSVIALCALYISNIGVKNSVFYIIVSVAAMILWGINTVHLYQINKKVLSD